MQLPFVRSFILSTLNTSLNTCAFVCLFFCFSYTCSVPFLTSFRQCNHSARSRELFWHFEGISSTYQKHWPKSGEGKQSTALISPPTQNRFPSRYFAQPQNCKKKIEKTHLDISFLTHTETCRVFMNINSKKT